MEVLMNKLIASTALLAAVVTPSASFAQSHSRTAVVTYADLDLASEAGRSTLQRRISAAVREVCPQYLGTSLIERAHRIACTREARASAQAQLRLAIARRQGGAELALRSDR
jgi:UrcA family protein